MRKPSHRFDMRRVQWSYRQIDVIKGTKILKSVKKFSDFTTYLTRDIGDSENCFTAEYMLINAYRTRVSACHAAFEDD